MKTTGDKPVSIPTAIAISKMLNVEPSDNNGKGPTVDVGGLEGVVRQLTKKEAINEDLLTLFPDMQFCAETVSLSIVSPNDMVTKNINLNLENVKLSADLKGSLFANIKSDINNYYNLSNKLPEIVQEALFMKGAYVECFIPENVLDDIINPDKKAETGDITVESFNNFVKHNNKGIFGKKSTFSANEYSEVLKSTFKPEDLTIESGNVKFEDNKTIKIEDELKVEFLDDISCLYTGALKNKVIKDDISKLYETKVSTLSKESAVTAKETLYNIFKQRTFKDEVLLNINNVEDGSRKPLGRPLNIKLDMNTVKPIWSGTPDNHIGYLVLLDENSNLLNSKNFLEGNGFDNSGIMYGNNTRNITDGILNRAYMGLKSMTEKDQDISQREELYSAILHNTIIKKLQEGKLKNVANLSKDQNFLKMMFTRALKGRKTKILFLPTDVVSYIAYEYKDNGIGLSKLDKISVIISMRAIMLFAKLMANIKNSIPITEVEATIDNDVPDVKEAVNKIISSTMKNHQVSLPIGTANINDLVQWVHNLGYVYNIESDRLPNTKVKLNDSSRNIRAPEDTVSEILEELCYMEFFMNSEMVRSGKDANFATTVITQNKLFENRILKQQAKTEIALTKHIRKIIKNDAVVKEGIKDVITANYKELEKLNKNAITELTTKGISKDDVIDIIIDIIIDDITVTLPRPTSLSEGTNLKTTLTDYSDAVDLYIDKIFDNEAFGSAIAGEELGENLDNYKAIMKKMLIHEWINDNNYIPSMSKFLTLDDAGQSLNNIFTQYSDMMGVFGNLITDFKKKNKKVIDKLNTNLEKITGNEEEEDNLGDGESEPIEDDTPKEGDDITPNSDDILDDDKKSEDTLDDLDDKKSDDDDDDTDKDEEEEKEKSNDETDDFEIPDIK